MYYAGSTYQDVTPLSSCSSYQRHAVSFGRAFVSSIRISRPLKSVSSNGTRGLSSSNSIYRRSRVHSDGLKTLLSTDFLNVRRIQAFDTFKIFTVFQTLDVYEAFRIRDFRDTRDVRSFRSIRQFFKFLALFNVKFNGRFLYTISCIPFLVYLRHLSN